MTSTMGDDPLSTKEGILSYFKSENLEKEARSCLVGPYLISKHKLGEGGTSVVKLALNKHKKALVAVKIVAKYRLTDRGRDNLERELQIHSFISKFNHPNICNLHEVIETNQHFFIFLEYVPDGDLVSHIESKGKVPEDEAKPIFRQAVEAIQFLHSNSIVHRDIKAENFLVNRTGRAVGSLVDDALSSSADSNSSIPLGLSSSVGIPVGPSVVIKLSDFGLADWMNGSKSFSTPCGSPCYTAPEVVEKKQYRGEPTDVWSAGILLYALLVGEFPFSHPNILALFDQIKKGQYALPDYLSEDAQDLVRRMLTRDAFLRPTVEQVLDHPWLAKRDEPVVVDLRLPPSWFTP